MIVYSSTTANPKPAMYASAMPNVSAKKFLNHGYCMEVLDGRQRHSSIELLIYKDGVGWAVNSLQEIKREQSWNRFYRSFVRQNNVK